MKKIFTIIYLCFVCIIGYSQNCPSFVNSSRSTMHTCNELGSISFDLGYIHELGSVQVNYSRYSPSHITEGTDYPNTESGTFNFPDGSQTIEIYNLIAGSYELLISFPDNPDCQQIRHDIDVPYYKSYDYQNVFNYSGGYNYKYYSKSSTFFSHIKYACLENTLVQDNSIYSYGYNPGSYYFKWYRSEDYYSSGFTEFSNTQELPEFGWYYCEVIDSYGCVLETSPVYNVYNVPVSPPTAQEEQHFCSLDSPKISDIKYTVQPNNGTLYRYSAAFYDAPDISAVRHYDNSSLVDGKTYYLLTTVEVNDYQIIENFHSVEFTPVTVHFYSSSDAPPPAYEIAVDNSTISIVNPPQEIVYTTESPNELTYRYEYSLNNGDYVYESEFINVPEGSHTIKIRENKSNCKITEQSVIVGALGNSEFSTLNNIRISPNPAQNEITISGLFNNASIVIYDISGREILSLNTTGVNPKINVSSLTNGTYILKINSQNGTTNTKFIKE